MNSIRNRFLLAISQLKFKKFYEVRCVCSNGNNVYWNDRYEEGEKKFEKVLIANRGEIACRIIDTCKRLDIKTVAIHSDVDSTAKFVRMSDEAYCIGPAPTSQSYLDIDKIMKVIQLTGSQAVHPGYGFLSENRLFAERLADAGVAFVGPSSESIKAMGDKIESKRIAGDAGVSLIPGYDGQVDSVDEAVKIAKEIGYPVMIKASAGGGGKGMRVAWNDEETRSGFQLSKEEASSSFGDDRMLIEKYIDNPRHIEIQVLCDGHGNAVYLNERECSIQRRNQKVIEEAPSTYLDDKTRAAMGAQAVALAKAVNYSSAGTVEFLVDSSKKFYFLEMNTRLQVEHPITESITGVDLVHQMLRVARGHKLVHSQSDIPLKGWSFECRVYAEDPYKNFGLPSIGRLTKYIEPTYIPNVRCDSGIAEGSHISIYYDPMICKLVTFGADRASALSTMIEALDSYVIRGVTHNIPLLRDILTEKRFIAGDLTTNYLPEVYPDGFKGSQLVGQDFRILYAVAACIAAKQELRCLSAVKSSAFSANWNFHVLHDQEGVSLHVSLKNNQFKVKIANMKEVIVEDDFTLSQPVLNLTIDSQPTCMQLIHVNPSGQVQLQLKGTIHPMRILSEEAAQFMNLMPVKEKADLASLVIAPMPGVVKSVAIEVGESVGQGQQVCVLEAMKMQNSMVAGKTGKVRKVNVKPGQTVSEEDVLVELE